MFQGRISDRTDQYALAVTYCELRGGRLPFADTPPAVQRGYFRRGAFVAGDPVLVAQLLEVRKHAGMIVPAPVQAAMIAGLGDPDHVAEQRGRYAALFASWIFARRLSRRASSAGNSSPRRSFPCWASSSR